MTYADTVYWLYMVAGAVCIAIGVKAWVKARDTLQFIMSAYIVLGSSILLALINGWQP